MHWWGIWVRSCLSCWKMKCRFKEWNDVHERAFLEAFLLQKDTTCRLSLEKHTFGTVYPDLLSEALLNVLFSASFILLNWRLPMLSSSVVSNSLQPLGLQPTRLLCPWGFCRQEYWSALPCPPPGDLPNPGIEPRSLALQADSLPSEPPARILEWVAYPFSRGSSQPRDWIGVSHIANGFPELPGKPKDLLVFSKCLTFP